MNLLICHAGDKEALWLYACCLKYKADITLINADTLPCALQWNYRISTKETTLNILPANKKMLATENIDVVINRISAAIPMGWEHAAPDEQQYVTQEIHAFFLSWLYSLSCETLMLNPPGENALSGHFYLPPQWVNLAHEAGLQVGDYAENSSCGSTPPLPNAGEPQTNVLVVQNKIFGTLLPRGIAAGCKKLTQLSGNNMLEILLDEQHGWQFKSANTFPHFSLYGQLLVQQIIHLLT